MFLRQRAAPPHSSPQSAGQRKHLFVAVWVLALVVTLLHVPIARAQTPPQAKYVLVISCDGLRPDAIEPAKAETMLRLIRTGSFHASMLADLPPVTLPNHVSMATGLSVHTHGTYLNMDIPGRIKHTTIFDIAKQAELCVGFFVSKNKLGFLCEEHAVDAWRKAVSVEEVTQVTCEAIQRLDMNLIFVHYGDPDGTGHRSGWMTEDYFAAVRNVDSGISRILQAIEAKGHLKNTVVIVTADHGGHEKSHYLDAPCDRHIPFIVNGPGIAVGRSLDGTRTVMDVAATTLELLGLPTESAADGVPIQDAYAGFVGVEKPTEPVSKPGMPSYVWLLLPLPALIFIAWRSRRSS